MSYIVLCCLQVAVDISLTKWHLMVYTKQVCFNELFHEGNYTYCSSSTLDKHFQNQIVDMSKVKFEVTVLINTDSDVYNKPRVPKK